MAAQVDFFKQWVIVVKMAYHEYPLGISKKNQEYWENSK